MRSLAIGLLLVRAAGRSRVGRRLRLRRQLRTRSLAPRHYSSRNCLAAAMGAMGAAPSRTGAA